MPLIIKNISMWGGGESARDTEEVEEMIRNLKKKLCGPATGLYSYPRSRAASI